MTKVLFIAGAGRSGSTILHNVLGQIDGFAACGELRYIWGRAALKNQLCGCGQRFRACPFWVQVMERAYGGLDKERARTLLDYTASFRVHKLPMTWMPAVRHRELARLRDYLDTLDTLYTAIAAVSGCRVIVDSSKNPSYGYLLRQLDSIRPYYLHFVRDSPPVAHSWGKEKDFEPGVPMARKPPIQSALQWNARNLTAEWFLPRKSADRKQIRYEDFVLRPRDHVAAIMEWLGEPAKELPFTSQHEAVLEHANHSVFGNSVRFQKGTVALKSQEGWRQQMSHRDRIFVQGLTLPLRARYGYLRTGIADPVRRQVTVRGLA